MDRVEYFKMLSAISGHVDVYYYFAIEPYIHALPSKSILYFEIDVLGEIKIYQT